MKHINELEPGERAFLNNHTQLRLTPKLRKPQSDRFSTELPTATLITTRTESITYGNFIVPSPETVGMCSFTLTYVNLKEFLHNDPAFGRRQRRTAHAPDVAASARALIRNRRQKKDQLSFLVLRNTRLDNKLKNK